MVRRALKGSYRVGRKAAIAAIGVGLVVLGIAMLLLPGPGLLVIPLGLAILAIEFAWARRWLERLRVASVGVAGQSRDRAA
jgi:tellurite resistance protein TerC